MVSDKMKNRSVFVYLTMAEKGSVANVPGSNVGDRGKICANRPTRVSTLACFCPEMSNMWRSTFPC